LSHATRPERRGRASIQEHNAARPCRRHPTDRTMSTTRNGARDCCVSSPPLSAHMLSPAQNGMCPFPRDACCRLMLGRPHCGRKCAESTRCAALITSCMYCCAREGDGTSSDRAGPRRCRTARLSVTSSTRDRPPSDKPRLRFHSRCDVLGHTVVFILQLRA